MPHEEHFQAILIETGPSEKNRLYQELLQTDGCKATPRVALWPAHHSSPWQVLHLLNANGLKARLVKVKLTEVTDGSQQT